MYTQIDGEIHTGIHRLLVGQEGVGRGNQTEPVWQNVNHHKTRCGVFKYSLFHSSVFIVGLKFFKIEQQWKES